LLHKLLCWCGQLPSLKSDSTHNFFRNASEIQRGLAGIGNFQLKTEFLHARFPKDEICIPRHVIKPEDIAKHVMAETDCVREDCVKESMDS
jgi:hypothetical protein